MLICQHALEMHGRQPTGTTGLAQRTCRQSTTHTSRASHVQSETHVQAEAPQTCLPASQGVSAVRYAQSWPNHPSWHLQKPCWHSPCPAWQPQATTCNGQLNAAQHASKQPMSSMASRRRAAPTVALVRAVCFYRRFAVATTVTILQAARAGLLLVQSGDGGMHSTAASRRRIEERVQTHQGARARPIWFVRLHADTGDGHWWVDSDVFCTQVLACMHSSDGCHLYMQQLAPDTTHPSRTGALVPHCQSLWDCQHHPAGHGRVQHAKQMCCCAQCHNSDTLTGSAAQAFAPTRTLLRLQK